MTKAELNELLKSIKENRAIATAEIPPDVMPGDIQTYQVLRVRAQERALASELEYRNFVDTHMGGIILQGPVENQRKFAEIAAAKGKTVNFDTLNFYRKMTDVAYFMGQGSLTADQIALVYTELRLASRTVNIFRLRDPLMDWMMAQVWTTPDDFANGVRLSLFKSNGINLTGTTLKRYVEDESLKTLSTRTTIPVVVVGVPENELSEWETLFLHGSIVVDVKEVTEESVVEVFNQLKTQITNKEKTNG